MRSDPVKLLAALERQGRLLSERPPAEVWRLLRSCGVTLRPQGEQIRALGSRSSIEFAASAIREHRNALLAGACALCGVELATIRDRCAWCDAVRGRRVEYPPGGAEEGAILAAIEGAATDLAA